MTRRPSRPRVALGTGVALAVVVAWHGPLFGLYPPLFLRNTGFSLPPGVYVYDHAVPVGRGEIVAYPHPPHYRHPFLMKRVEGLAGDRYCWRPERGTHALNGRLMAPPSRLARARGVPVWTGCVTLEPGEVVGYGAGDSYDGRYFGPVAEADLWGVYRPFAPRRESGRP